MQKLARAKAKIASALHGHPARDLKIIAITGDTGENIVASFLFKILIAHQTPSALITSSKNDPLSASTLHKYLAKSLKSGVTHVVIAAPSPILKKHIFHQLPIHMSVLTNTAPPESIDTHTLSTLNHQAALFQNSPRFSVLNRDDHSFSHFSTLPEKDTLITYGLHPSSHVRISRSKLYKKGTEASLTIDSTSFSVATYVLGATAVPLMAAATAAAALLDIPKDTIIDGIASYEP